MCVTLSDKRRTVVFLSCDTLEDAERDMDELATAINKAN